jgi:hypothetical protein
MLINKTVAIVLEKGIMKFGLIYATILTLVVVTLIYVIIARYKEKRERSKITTDNINHSI